MNFNFEITQIIELEEVSSTQDLAKELAKEGNLSGNTAICAQSQTAGRGRFEHTWQSETGGLYLSLLLNPTKKTSSIADLSIKTGQAAALALEEMFNLKTEIKLPNDVLVKTKQGDKKICGVLIESAVSSDKLEWLIVGVGVNLNNKVSKDLNAANVKDLIKKEVDVKAFRETFFKHFSAKYIEWQLSK